jgi:hypothetical protein
LASVLQKQLSFAKYIVLPQDNGRDICQLITQGGCHNYNVYVTKYVTKFGSKMDYEGGQYCHHNNNSFMYTVFVPTTPACLHVANYAAFRPNLL